MHKSLTRAASRNLILAWMAWTAVTVVVTRAAVVPSFAVGAVFGVCAGLLQTRALKANPAAFAAAVSAFDVRHALRATRAGTLRRRTDDRDVLGGISWRVLFGAVA